MELHGISMDMKAQELDGRGVGKWKHIFYPDEVKPGASEIWELQGETQRKALVDSAGSPSTIRTFVAELEGDVRSPQIARLARALTVRGGEMPTRFNTVKKQGSGR